MIEARFTGRLGDFVLDADIAVPASGVTVLFGPSGCGKTTVLRCLAGLTRLPGRLTVAGEVWQDGRRFTPPHRRPVGYVFQEASLFAHLSVRGNLLYGRRRVKAAATDTDHVIALLGLEPLLGRGTARLSGGERQRVAIGRALLTDPALLLMDEPLASLDAARKAEVLPYLDALCREAAIPIVYVTHDRAEAARLGERMLVMEAGRIAGVLDPRTTQPDEARELERLTGRLKDAGTDAVRQELMLQGASPAVARLAVEAMIADLGHRA